MRPHQIVEATLFASQTPLTVAELARADEGLDARAVREALQTLRERYEEAEHAFQVYQLGDGFQLLTRPEFAPYLERFDSVPRPPTLSRAALETLAIIAYRQPLGRIEIEDIRGVASTSVLRTLQDWELIDVVGRGDGLGRPLLYGTTPQFLDHFGFRSLDELPHPDDLPIALRQVEEPESPGPHEASDGEGADAGTSGGTEAVDGAEARGADAASAARARVGDGEPPARDASGNGSGARNGTGPDPELAG